MNIDLTLSWAFITAMNSIAPARDGNETWQVMGGGGLLAACPVADG